MTCGVTMLYYVLHTRPITDGKRVCERCHGAVAPLPAGRAVNELQAAGLRLAPAAASLHCDCLAAADILQRINDNSATMTTSAVVAIADGAKMDFAKVYDNKLTRSVKNYRTLQAKSKSAEGVLSKGDTLSCLYPPLT